MYDPANSIPVTITRLIILFLHNKLSPSQQQELDNWLGEAEHHDEVFASLIDGVSDNVFDPDQLLIETEEAIDLWVIAGLVLRRVKKLNSQIEEDRLTEWIQASERNQLLYQKMQEAAFTQQVINWSREEMGKRGYQN